jgi:hypothetical protein
MKTFADFKPTQGIFGKREDGQLIAIIHVPAQFEIVERYSLTWGSKTHVIQPQTIPVYAVVDKKGNINNDSIKIYMDSVVIQDQGKETNTKSSHFYRMTDSSFGAYKYYRKDNDNFEVKIHPDFKARTWAYDKPIGDKKFGIKLVRKV